jgi:catechol 2,3-dioxygenase-like lactoylglutathione lyase family enzyme
MMELVAVPTLHNLVRDVDAALEGEVGIWRFCGWTTSASLLRTSRLLSHSLLSLVSNWRARRQLRDLRWTRLVGLDDVRTDIALMRTPDGHSRIELMKFQRPTAVRAEPKNAPANTLGIRRIMFAVDDIEYVVARLRAHGAQLVGELTQYEDKYRLCYVRGPEGILVALAEQLPTAGAR